MQYKYITNNNLEDIQTYMYSEYGGVEFLNEYFNSRGDIPSPELYDRDEIVQVISVMVDSDSAKELLDIWQKIHKDGYSASKQLVDLYVKRFEVRKRIYRKYEKSKAVTESGYDDYPAYILLGMVLADMYEINYNLKYLSCLLKVTDTLLSIKGLIDNNLCRIMTIIIEREKEYVRQLLEKNGVELEKCDD